MIVSSEELQDAIEAVELILKGPDSEEEYKHLAKLRNSLDSLSSFNSSACGADGKGSVARRNALVSTVFRTLFDYRPEMVEIISTRKLLQN
jgi:hypothetical protein